LSVLNRFTAVFGVEPTEAPPEPDAREDAPDVERERLGVLGADRDGPEDDALL
jgi:hypothetical protein